MGRDKQTETAQDDPGRKAQFGRIAAWTEPKPGVPVRDAAPPEEQEEKGETEAA